jgi:hypothetical protein
MSSGRGCSFCEINCSYSGRWTLSWPSQRANPLLLAGLANSSRCLVYEFQPVKARFLCFLVFYLGDNIATKSCEFRSLGIWRSTNSEELDYDLAS